MIAHSHPHEHGKDKAPHPHPTELWRGLHRNWRAWVIIGLMLAAIGTYVFTLDDSVQPGGVSSNAGPTAVIPVNPSK